MTSPRRLYSFSNSWAKIRKVARQPFGEICLPFSDGLGRNKHNEKSETTSSKWVQCCTLTRNSHSSSFSRQGTSTNVCSVSPVGDVRHFTNEADALAVSLRFILTGKCDITASRT